MLILFSASRPAPSEVLQIPEPVRDSVGQAAWLFNHDSHRSHIAKQRRGKPKAFTIPLFLLTLWSSSFITGRVWGLFLFSLFEATVKFKKQITKWSGNSVKQEHIFSLASFFFFNRLCLYTYIFFYTLKRTWMLYTKILIIVMWMVSCLVFCVFHFFNEYLWFLWSLLYNKKKNTTEFLWF